MAVSADPRGTARPVPGAASGAAADLRTRVTVETPEMVEFSFEVAGIGSRFAAGCIDSLIVGGLLLALLAVFWLGGEAIPFATFVASALQGVALLSVFVLLWGYHLYFETFRGGRSPGKRLLRLRVVTEGGLPCTLPRAAVRNLLRVVDAFPPPLYGVAGVAMFADGRARRLGDLAAGTVVVRERALVPPEALARVRPANRADVERGRALAPAEAALVAAFLARRDELVPEARDRLARSVAARIALRRGEGPPVDAENWIERLGTEGP